MLLGAVRWRRGGRGRRNAGPRFEHQKSTPGAALVAPNMAALGREYCGAVVYDTYDVNTRFGYACTWCTLVNYRVEARPPINFRLKNDLD